MGKNKNLWYAVVAFTLVFNVCLVALVVYDKQVGQPKKYKQSEVMGYSEMSEEPFCATVGYTPYIDTYKIMQNDETGVAYAYFEDKDSRLLMKLLNADGTEKMYFDGDENVLTVRGKEDNSIIFEDRDTGVFYLVQEDYDGYEVR